MPRPTVHVLFVHVLSVLQVFMAHTYLELQQNEQAVRIYDGLSQAGLAESTYIMAQVQRNGMSRVVFPRCAVRHVTPTCTLTISPFHHLKRFF